MGSNNIACFANLIVQNVTKSTQEQNIHDLEISVSFPKIPDVRMSVMCEGNENCYKRQVPLGQFLALVTSRIKIANTITKTTLHLTLRLSNMKWAFK